MKTITMTALFYALQNYHCCIDDSDMVYTAEWADDSKTEIVVTPTSTIYHNVNDQIFIESIMPVDDNGIVTVKTNEGTSVIKFFKQFNPFE